MAKKTPAKSSTPKKSAAAPKKSAAPRKAANPKQSLDIAEVCTSALNKLRELDLDYQLQSEIEWCLNSYASDGNPVGLHQMARRALHEFRNLIANEPKAVSAKLIKDLEGAAKEK
jgi:hypothetical protein